MMILLPGLLLLILPIIPIYLGCIKKSSKKDKRYLERWKLMNKSNKDSEKSMVEVEKSIEVDLPSELRNNSAYKSAMKEPSDKKKKGGGGQPSGIGKSEMKPSLSQQPQSNLCCTSCCKSNFVPTSCCQSNINESRKNHKSMDESRKRQQRSSEAVGKSRRKPKKKGGKNKTCDSSEDNNRNVFSTENSQEYCQNQPIRSSKEEVIKVSQYIV